jgi:glutamate/tyrosine decarboxylase-like PLP-dependent enzyme
LQYYGTRRLAQAISDDISLAEYLGELVAQANDCELLAPVELSICCFRYIPPQPKTEAEIDRFNERLMELVPKGGRAYLSNATVGGKFALRACITNFRTTKSDIDETIEAIRDAARIA